MQTACHRCGLPGYAVGGGADFQDPVSAIDSDSSAASLVARCQHCKTREFRFDRVDAMWAYLDSVREAIVKAKYAHQAPLAEALGRRLAGRLSFPSLASYPDLVTFVPSHFTRQFSRGGNGSQTIATAVATGIGLPCRQLLRITRKIAKQAWLDETDRAKNVRGAFAPKKSYDFLRSPRIADRHILLVDDVLTTGATANEVAGVLKDAGASRVTLAVVARAVGC